MAETVYRKSARASGKTAVERTRLYRAVHAACRSNGIDEDARRAIQSDLFGKGSLSDMTTAEIARLLNHLNRNRPHSSRGGPAANRTHIGKVRALWWSLYWLGEVNDHEDRAISAFVKRQTGVNALRWLDHRSAPSVIEALKGWAERAGVTWPTPADVDAMRSVREGYGMANAERLAVIRALSQRIVLRRLGTPSNYVTAWLDANGRGTGIVTLPMLEVAELDGLIRHLGQIVRTGRKVQV